MIILLFIISSISSIEIEIKNKQIIKGELIAFRNNKYFVADGKTLFQIKQSSIKKVLSINPEEMELLLYETKAWDIEENFEEIIEIPQPRKSDISLRANVCLETLSRQKYEYQTVDFDTTRTDSVNHGWSFSCEALISLSSKLFAGIGLNQQLPRKVKGQLGSEFAFSSVYALSTFRLFDSQMLALNALLNVGYGFYNIKDRGFLQEPSDSGLCWNVGLESILAERYILQISWQNQNRKFSLEVQNFKNNYQSLSIAWGIKIF
jgi:hypothetical protein